MGMTDIELTEHCKQILRNSSIKKNQIVILCEGIVRDVAGGRSPQAYGNMDRLPDANFYLSCVPRTWRGKLRPKFINCGDRNDVINTYFRLVDLAKTAVTKLNPEKLFAIIDLDLQPKAIANYHIQDVETIFAQQYQNNKILLKAIEQHRILVTGLIHKEAYFLLPEFQEFLDLYTPQPLFKQEPVLLSDIYLKICAETTEDKDLMDAFERVSKRIDYCSQIDRTCLENFKTSWCSQFTSCSDFPLRQDLISTLLTVRKAKPYWKQISFKTDDDSEERDEKDKIHREQLSLQLGKQISRQNWDNPANHLAYWFKLIYQFA